MTRQRAYLYIRVSIEKQADKGYSQRNQDEQLRKYCDHHNIAIAGASWEDYSGRHRPTGVQSLPGTCPKTSKLRRPAAFLEMGSLFAQRS
jgi:hypothetical protein